MAKGRLQTRQHGAANDNGDPQVRLDRVRIDPWLLAAIDTWVEAQKDPKPSRSEAVAMALYEWAAGMGLARDRVDLKANVRNCLTKTLNPRSLKSVSPVSSETAPRLQVAALPVRLNACGAVEVLLITSRDANRWIIPKGWPMKNRNDCDAAAREAREEAGVVGRVKNKPIGTYDYWKCQAGHRELCRVTVYPLVFDHQRKNWPEKGQREVCWFSLMEAAARVKEPGLREIIQSLNAYYRL